MTKYIWLIKNRYSHGVGGKAEGDGEFHDFDMRSLSSMADMLSVTFSLILRLSHFSILYSLPL
jgi:hypothetical protein